MEARGEYKLNSKGLVDASEYRHLNNVLFPDHLQLKITDPNGKTRTISLSELEAPFLLNIQPGPSYAGTREKPAPKVWALPHNWGEIPGAGGCTKEAKGIHSNLSTIVSKCGVYGLSNKPAEQQQLAIKEKELAYPLLSDEALVLAQALRLPVARNVERTVTVVNGVENTNLFLEQEVKEPYVYIERVTLLVGRDRRIKKVFCGIDNPEKFGCTILPEFAESLPDLTSAIEESALTEEGLLKEFVVDVGALKALKKEQFALNAGANVNGPNLFAVHQMTKELASEIAVDEQNRFTIYHV